MGRNSKRITDNVEDEHKFVDKVHSHEFDC